MIEVVAAFAGMFGMAAAVILIVEGTAKLIGSRNAWILFLGIFPLALSIGLSAVLWERLSLWERIVYPLSGPLVVAAALLMGTAAVVPDVLLLLCAGLRRGWELMRAMIGRGHRKA